MDFIKVLQEIRGTGAAEVEYTDGIFWELTIELHNGNPGIYGDILYMYNYYVTDKEDFDTKYADFLIKYADVLDKWNDVLASAAIVNAAMLGGKTEDPIVDNDGNPLQVGALYYNTFLDPNHLRIYTDTGWKVAAFDPEYPVLSFNGRDGYIILTVADIENTLGFTVNEYTVEEKAKLAGIEDNATIDQTDAEISALMKDYTESMTNKTLIDPSNHIHADRIDLEAKNTSGSLILAGSPVTFTEVNTGDNYEITLTDQATMIASGITESDIAADAIGTIVLNGRCPFNTENYTEGEILYVNGGTLTNIEPATGYSQPIAVVLKDAVDGILQVLAAYPKQDADDVRYSEGVSVKTQIDNTANVTTDLSLGVRDINTLGVNSSDGGDIILPAATQTLAGLLTGTDKTKLDGIETSAKDDQVASEVPFTANGDIVATDVQSAVQEVRDDTDTKLGLKLDKTGGTISSNLTVSGNLYVNGDEVIISTTTVEVEDNLMLINKGEAGAGVTAGSAGIEIDRGTATNYEFKFDEVDDSFKVGEIGTLQKVATREDTPTDGGVAIWDLTTSKFITTKTPTVDSIHSVGTITTDSTVDGRDVATDGAKLDLIEDNAKDDQNAAEVPFNNTTSGLTATEVQAAIDEVDSNHDSTIVRLDRDLPEPVFPADEGLPLVAKSTGATYEKLKALGIIYDNIASGLVATDVKNAIDEISDSSVLTGTDNNFTGNNTFTQAINLNVIETEDETKSFNVADVANAMSTPYSHRNKIINGGFDIDQRTGGLVNEYTLDRWKLKGIADNASQSTQTVDGAGNAIRVVATGEASIRQGIELTKIGINSQFPIGKTFTLSGNIKGDAGQHILVSAMFEIILGDATDRVIEFERIDIGTILTTDIYQFFSYTFTIASTCNISNKCLTISLYNTLAGTIRWSNIQLEEGSIATPFEQRPIGYELSLCQRYYQIHRLQLYIYGKVATNYIERLLPTEMRADPSITGNGTAYGGAVIGGDTGYLRIATDSAADQNWGYVSSGIEFDAEL